MQLESPNLTQTRSQLVPETHLFGGQRSRSWVTKTLLAWVFALFWVLASSCWNADAMKKLYYEVSCVEWEMPTEAQLSCYYYELGWAVRQMMTKNSCYCIALVYCFICVLKCVLCDGINKFHLHTATAKLATICSHFFQVNGCRLHVLNTRQRLTISK